MDEEFVFSYSDIIFEKSVLEKLLQSESDISLVVDTGWIEHYQHRYQHPVKEAKIVMVENNKIIKIRKNIDCVSR